MNMGGGIVSSAKKKLSKQKKTWIYDNKHKVVGSSVSGNDMFGVILPKTFSIVPGERT